MKFSHFTFASVLLLLVFSSCSKNVPVYNVQSSNYKSGGKGFFYALPQTVVNVDFVISRTDLTKAPFGEYADSIFGIKNKVDSSFKIEEVNIGNTSEVDSSQWYFVDLGKQGLFKKVTITTETNETGIISNGSAEVENKSVEYVAEFVEYTASVASKFIPSPTFGSITKSSSGANEMMDFEELMAPKPNKPTRKMTKKDSAQQVLNEIGRVREMRLQLVANKTGTTVSEGTLQIMLKELDGKEQELLALFLGEKKVKKIKLHFRTSSINNQTLFKFSPEHGLSDYPNAMDVESKFVNSKKDGDFIQLMFHVQSNLPSAMTGTITAEKSSFFYRIPVNTEVQVWKKSKIIFLTEFPIAQLGTVKCLPLKSGSMKSKYELKYDPKTGALLKITVTGDPISSDAIDKLKSSGNQVIDLVKPDKLTDLENQRKILEEQKKILDLQKELESKN